MNDKQAQALASIFGGEAWQSGGGIWLAAYWRGDGKYIVFSGDAVCEYDSEEDFDDGKATNTILLASGDEEWWVVGDDKGNTFFQSDEFEVGWRSQEEAEHEASYLQSREGGHFFARRQEDEDAAP
jgi:hypothetical protein